MYCLFLTLALFYLRFAFIARAYLMIIDDSDSTVQYYGMFGKFVNDSRLDNTMVFNGTITVNECCTEDSHCRIKIPFVGSGITVYSLVYISVKIGISIDGDPFKSGSYLNDSCYPDDPCYNVSVCDEQSLTYTDHTLDINMVSGHFYFHYAVINDTRPATVTSTITRNKRATVGTLASLAAVAALLLAGLYIRRRNILSERERNHTTAFPIDLPSLPPYGVSSTSLLTVRHNTHKQTTRAPPMYTRPTPNIHPEVDIAAHMLTLSSPVAPAAQETTPSSVPMVSEIQGLVPALPPASMASHITVIHTERQIGGIGSMVQRLFRQNVPIPVVATVIEGMLSEQELSTGNDGSRAGLSQTSAPPSYDST